MSGCQQSPAAAAQHLDGSSAPGRISAGWPTPRRCTTRFAAARPVIHARSCTERAPGAGWATRGTGSRPCSALRLAAGRGCRASSGGGALCTRLRQAVGPVVQPLDPVTRQEQVLKAGGLQSRVGWRRGQARVGTAGGTHTRRNSTHPSPPCLPRQRTCVGRHCALPGLKCVTARGKRSTAASTTCSGPRGSQGGTVCIGLVAPAGRQGL